MKNFFAIVYFSFLGGVNFAWFICCIKAYQTEDNLFGVIAMLLACIMATAIAPYVDFSSFKEK